MKTRNRKNRLRAKRPSTNQKLRIESLEARTLLSVAPAAALPLDQAAITATAVDDFEVAAIAAATVSVEFNVSDDWGSGFVMQAEIGNYSGQGMSAWSVEMDFDHEITNIWNARVVSHVGNHYVISNETWNADLASGGTVAFGFQGFLGNVTVLPANVTVNGIPIDGEIPEPTISVGDTVVTEPDTQVLAEGFFHTDGNQIVDSEGNNVRIAGVNWFGLETTDFAPHGLWARNYKDMMDQMKETGFNTIRLPFSNQMLDAGSVPSSINYALNPELQGLNGLGIMDKVVDYAGEIGLRIILDHHRSTAGNSAQENGLWYTEQYSDTRWISDWQMLAQRYADNSTVIGADLHNEPHGPATWGSGNASTDWQLAAERCGDAIGGVNSDWLILVEGIEYYDGQNSWWGGNLAGAGEHPVELAVAGRLVYSPHAYPNSVYHQRWFDDPSYPDNLPDVWDSSWGYLYREGTAPVLLGEFGSGFVDPLDLQWMDKMIDYIGGDLDGNGSHDLAAGDLGISWTYWSWNPNSGDTGGILNPDWTTINEVKLAALTPVQFQFPATDASGGFSTPQRATAVFEVALSGPGNRPVTVRYATVDGTATAGEDYVATSGTLTFAPGETTKTLSVTVLGDLVVEGNEQFALTLTDPSGATIEDGRATGTIIDNDEAAPIVPLVSVGDVSVVEGDGLDAAVTAVFNVSLSQPSGQTVTMHYRTVDGTAAAGRDYEAASGVLVFAPGETGKAVAVVIVGDTLVEPNERFTLEVTDVNGATALDDKGVATIVNDDEEPPPQPDPTVSVDDVRVSEEDGAANFTVELSRATDHVVTVDYTTKDSSAAAGMDYLAAAGTLTFAPGETSKTVSVQIIDDILDESSEEFFLDLTGSAGGDISDGHAVGIILDNDVSTVAPVDFNVRDNWGSGFVMDAMVTNTTAATVSGWTVEFDYDGDIVNIWNAEIVQHTGNHYVLRCMAWNSNLATGQAATFGFQATPGAGGNLNPANVRFLPDN